MDINYRTSKRSDWRNFYKLLTETESVEDGQKILWSNWINANNPNRNKFKTVEALIFNLLTYKSPNAQIGSFSITADSVPVYNTWSNWWNGIEVWECPQWIEWFEKNNVKYGANSTKYKFVNAWSYADNFSIGVWGDGMGYTCGRDCDFINYFRVKGIDVTVWGAQTVCNLVSIPTNLIDATANLTQTISNTTNVTKNVLPLAVGLAIIAFFYNKSK